MNKEKLSTLVAVALTSAVFCDFTVSAASVLHAYGFDGDFSDAAGSANGMANGNAAINLASKFGSGSLGGLIAGGDYVSTPYFSPPGTTNNGTSGSRAYSLSVWINGYTSGGDKTIFAWGQNGSNSESERLSVNSNNALKFGLSDSGGESSLTGTISATGWIHLGVTLNGATSTATLYLNGQSINSFGGAFTGSPDTGEITMGNLSFLNTPLGGLMDDMAVWDGVLTDTEMVALNNLGNDSLNYDAVKSQALFDVFADGPGSQTSVDGQIWQYAAGLTGDEGDVVNSNTLILDAAGNGVQIVPEPSTSTLLASFLTAGCLLRKRRK